jgi:hypothetical protein
MFYFQGIKKKRFSSRPQSSNDLKERGEEKNKVMLLLFGSGWKKYTKGFQHVASTHNFYAMDA